MLVTGATEINFNISSAKTGASVLVLPDRPRQLRPNKSDHGVSFRRPGPGPFAEVEEVGPTHDDRAAKEPRRRGPTKAQRTKGKRRRKMSKQSRKRNRR